MASTTDATVTSIADAQASRRLRAIAVRRPMPDDKVRAVGVRTTLGDIFIVEQTMPRRMVARAADLVAAGFGRGEQAVVLFLDDIETGTRYVNVRKLLASLREG